MISVYKSTIISSFCSLTLQNNEYNSKIIYDLVDTTPGEIHRI